MITEIIILGVAIGGYMLYKSSNKEPVPKKQTTNISNEVFKMTVAMQGTPQSLEERAKYEEDVKRSTYERNFQKKHALLLKVIFFIVKADSTFTKQEKEIVKELFEKLEDNNQYLTDRFLEYVYKKQKVTSIQAFKLNVNKLLISQTLDVDLLDFAKKIINTQKIIHPSEQEILDYLEKKSDENK
jgi:hypothetical protein